MIQLPPNSSGTILQSSVPVTGTGTAAPTYQAGEVQEVALTPSGKPTYRCAFTALNVGTGATTVLAQITGSATKVVKVTKVAVSGTEATAAAYHNIQLVKSSTAISGGTPSAGTNIPLDSGFGAATVTTQGFTAAPTAGTPVGTIAAKKIFLPITGTAANGVGLAEWDLSKYPVVLHGVAQSLDIKSNSETPANAPLLDIEIEWTEE
jgi:hypothetical protein